MKSDFDEELKAVALKTQRVKEHNVQDVTHSTAATILYRDRRKKKDYVRKRNRGGPVKVIMKDGKLL